MCGIVGYIGLRQAPEIIVNGLKRLEYRGYDSAGLAVVEDDGSISVRRDAGKLINLERLLQTAPVAGQVGIGHTRWATHGQPTSGNAHPHMGMGGQIVLVHNGIIENYNVLREELQAEGVTFNSETDTEVAAQLIERLMDGGLEFESATRAALHRLKGSSAFVVMHREYPDRLVAARLGNAGGIAIGIGHDEMFIASDIPAILEHTRDMLFLESRQMVILTRDAYKVMDLDGQAVASEVHVIPWESEGAAKGEYQHFMQKEIFEQPLALLDTTRGRADFDRGIVSLPTMNLTPELATRINKLFIIACGTSHFSGLVGKTLFEKMAKLPTEVAYASEFRYADPLVDENTVVLAITQSGETADTLAACELARAKGATMWSIVNAFGSQAMRVSDGFIAMQAGPEIGVASTKAFTTSLVDQYMLAVRLAELRGVATPGQVRRWIQDLSYLPNLAGRVLEQDAAFRSLAERFVAADDFLYLGRGINYPIALEGALKLKEISYIHAEGYPAGEMKHGPIALIDERMPVLAIATQDDLYDKMVSQIQQAKARNGIVIALATEGDEALGAEADYVIHVPLSPPLLAPIVNVIPLQLLAYHIAVLRGCDVDQPRNLAKSVTVE